MSISGSAGQETVVQQLPPPLFSDKKKQSALDFVVKETTSRPSTRPSITALFDKLEQLERKASTLEAKSGTIKKEEQQIHGSIEAHFQEAMALMSKHRQELEAARSAHAQRQGELQLLLNTQSVHEQELIHYSKKIELPIQVRSAKVLESVKGLLHPSNLPVPKSPTNPKQLNERSTSRQSSKQRNTLK